MNFKTLLRRLSLSAFFLITISGAALDSARERLNYKIIIPENASSACKFAATELGKFLEKAYAAPITLDDSDESIKFFVGVSGEAIMAGFTDLPDMHGKFGIFKKGRNILFFGYDDKNLDPDKATYGEFGTLMSVHYFLRKYVGANFYFPGENGFSIAKEAKIRLNSGPEIPSPSFSLRGISLATSEYSGPDKILFFHRSLCSVPRWANIDVYYIYLGNWKKRFHDSHPEYFMLRNGKRISENYPNHVPCFSNPDVVRQTVADIVEELNKNPDKTTVKLFSDAPINLCECENCKAMPERKFVGTDNDVSEVVYGYTKRIADIVRQSHPNVYFITQTKGDSYKEPPKLVKFDDHFTVNILTHQHTTKIEDQNFAVELARKWHAAGVRSSIFGYPRYSDAPTKNLPVIIPHFTAEFLGAFKGLTSGTTTSELNGNPYSFSALNQFVAGRLLFNVDENVDDLIGEFCSFAYPGAENEMISFYNEMEKLYRQRKDVSSDPFTDIYYAGNLEKPMKLLDEAAKKSGGQSEFLNKLYADFRRVYERALQEKPSVDEWMALKEKSIQASEKPFVLPFTNNTADITVSPDKWVNALKLEFSSPNLVKNFQESSAYMLCDSKFIYLGLVASEKSPEKLLRKCAPDDVESIWADDCFEFMIAPPEESFYYQIIGNSNGAISVLQREGKKVEPCKTLKFECKSSVLSDKWILTIKIPLAQPMFKELSPRKSWKFDIFRTRYCGEPAQSSGIRLLGKSYHETSEYCTLIWPEELAK